MQWKDMDKFLYAMHQLFRHKNVQKYMLLSRKKQYPKSKLGVNCRPAVDHCAEMIHKKRSTMIGYKYFSVDECKYNSNICAIL